MNVVFAYPLFRSFAPQIHQRLGAAHDLRFVSPGECADPGTCFDKTHVLVTARFPAAWIPRFPTLRLLHAAGAGLDKIDLASLPARVRVCRTFGHGPSIAEHVVMVMLALLRGLIPADRELRLGRWLNPQFVSGLSLPESLAEKTVVILGTGEIGSAVAALLSRAFGARCVGVNRAGRSIPDRGYARVWPIAALRSVLPDADFLVIALPLTDETRGLLGRAELALLPATAYLVNVARGPIVDEAALFEALQRQSLAGAAIDAWYGYPAADSNQAAPSRFPFGELANVILTPHLSGTTHATFRHRAEDIAANILALAAGEPLRNEVPRADRPFSP